MSLNITPTPQSASKTVSVAATSTQLLVSNDERSQVILQNCSMAPVFVLFGDGATTSNFSFILPAGTANNDGTSKPFISEVLVYTGIISAVVTTGTGNVQVTEL